AALGHDLHRFEAADDAGAGEHDRLKDVPFGANASHMRQVRADVPADVAELMARAARRLGPREDQLAAANVALMDQRQDLLNSLSLFCQVDIDERIQLFGL